MSLWYLSNWFWTLIAIIMSIPVALLTDNIARKIRTKRQAPSPWYISFTEGDTHFEASSSSTDVAHELIPQLPIILRPRTKSMPTLRTMRGKVAELKKNQDKTKLPISSSPSPFPFIDISHGQ